MLLLVSSQCFQLFGQAYDKSGKTQLSGEDITVEMYEGQDQKRIINRDFAIIGMNLVNSDGSEMGPFYITDSQDGYAYNYEDYPDAGFDHQKYAEAVRAGDYPVGEEEKTCKKEIKREKKKNKNTPL